MFKLCTYYVSTIHGSPDAKLGKGPHDLPVMNFIIRKISFCSSIKPISDNIQYFYLDWNVRPLYKEAYFSKQARIEEQFFYLALGARTIPLPYQIICLMRRSVVQILSYLRFCKPHQRQQKYFLKNLALGVLFDNNGPNIP